jgi:hypothetical protein
MKKLVHYLSVIEKIQAKNAAGDREGHPALLFLAAKRPNVFLTWPASVMLFSVARPLPQVPPTPHSDLKNATHSIAWIG